MPDLSPVCASVKSLSVNYDSRIVLSDINIDIMCNAVTAIIGPSGCGKSTLLRCFNRMNDYVSRCTVTGSLVIDGLDIYSKDVDVVSLRARVGMVFQKPNPFHKSVYDNVAYGPIIHKMTKNKSQLDAIVAESLKKVGLWESLSDRLHDSALKLSGGQQQRLCIARAIAVKPDTLLMDEPCSALDHAASAAIENLIIELKQRFTIVIVTHSLKQVRKLSDYVVLLKEGRLVDNLHKDEFFDEKNKSKYSSYFSEDGDLDY